MVVEKCDKASCGGKLTKLCAKRFELYRSFCRGKISREEYMKAIAPIDEVVDRLELSLIRECPTSRRETSVPEDWRGQ